MTFNQRQQNIEAGSQQRKTPKGASFKTFLTIDESGNHLYANCRILGLN